MNDRNVLNQQVGTVKFGNACLRKLARVRQKNPLQHNLQDRQSSTSAIPCSDCIASSLAEEPVGKKSLAMDEWKFFSVLVIGRLPEIVPILEECTIFGWHQLSNFAHNVYLL